MRGGNCFRFGGKIVPKSPRGDIRSRSDVVHRHVFPPTLNAQPNRGKAQGGSRLAPLALPQPDLRHRVCSHALHSSTMLPCRQYCPISKFIEGAAIASLERRGWSLTG